MGLWTSQQIIFNFIQNEKLKKNHLDEPSLKKN